MDTHARTPRLSQVSVRVEVVAVPVDPARGPEPVPAPECDVCELLALDREAARVNGQPLTVRSCNAVIAGHPHQRKPAL
ncbi:hypothetical protein [Streptomyces reniochalinae]|uniref:Uncharacterized protein n=1 Tax=Streptomyces reniochalinae TaxID=2250578 RepID=A0A367EIX1_9ACTN|nr:hypothetical protein [Streptomyces reniochalinae]RCG18024.1 hypothetical protein DQ392_15235 [Streptomyces reniochalinae]